MSSRCADTEFRRARPLLGTFVEISLNGLLEERADRAIAASFAAVARVQALMSPFDPRSDLRRLCAATPGTWVNVAPWSYEVLWQASRLFERSGGWFDPSVPASKSLSRREANWRDVVLGPRRQVMFRRSLEIDLGGIAKGFAVDRALACLRRAGAVRAVVNAGGDLRVFGERPIPVHLRIPGSPGSMARTLELSGGALATSAHYFDAPGQGRIRNPFGGSPWIGSRSVSVLASTCLVADALCKVVAAAGPEVAAPLLRSHGATVIVLDPADPGSLGVFPNAA